MKAGVAARHEGAVATKVLGLATSAGFPGFRGDEIEDALVLQFGKLCLQAIDVVVGVGELADDGVA